jgi:hypothetical protein
MTTFYQGTHEESRQRVEIGGGLLLTQNDSGYPFIGLNVDEGGTATGHNHDDLYYRESEADARFRLVTDDVPWADLADVPATFAPSAHALSGASHTGLLDDSQLPDGGTWTLSTPLLFDGANVNFTDNVGISGDLEVTGQPTFGAQLQLAGIGAGVSPFSLHADAALVPNLIAEYLGADGQTAAFFRDAGNLNAGLVAIARGGTGAATAVANRVFGGPASGADAAPSFRALVSDDIPNLSAAKITSGALAKAQQHAQTAYLDAAQTWTALQSATGANAASDLWAGKVTGEANSRWIIEANGDFLYGDGSVAPSDVEIGRTAAGAWGFKTGTIFMIGTLSIRTGAGTPEGAVTAPVGSLFLRTDGGAGTTLYVKQTGTGNTGWGAK